MASISELTSLRERADRMQREADRASGALQQALKRLKDEFGCSTLDEADQQLKRLRRQEQEAREAYDTALEKFEAKWKDEL